MHYIITLCLPGNKVLVRCLKLLKPYTRKGVTDDDDDEDDDDEDYTGAGRAVSPEGRIMEHDVLSQAYHIGTSDHFPRLRNRFQGHCVSGKLNGTSD